ncbi:hypothetical protein NQ315_011562 [Exocentrus adspersus]|uniref:Peptidase S1 domain-containing protein n=1 Tax=Exocentrus adspersus TaxID=1586481 RepID=A0AAV8VVD4_9CUCU|nr:hypothetical protein NQ315_011562 [Exocentrus adspersus]
MFYFSHILTMKITTRLLTFLGICLALPSTHLCHNVVKPGSVSVEPVSNRTAVQTQAVDGRIFGGVEVEPHSRPYLVALLVDGRSLCGGSLISLNFVLTAAHCTISASYVELVFGAHNILINESTQLRVTSSSIINHVDFNSSNYINDISLIKIPSPIVPNDHIQAVNLAPASAGSYTGFGARLSGWGITSNSNSSIPSGLHEVQLVVMGNSPCEDIYGPDVVQPSKLCTYGFGTVGGCSGDSGSPLVVGFTQVGITSFVSSNGCESGDPTGFTRISYYIPWIRENSDV